MTLENKLLLLAIGFGVAFVVVALTEKRCGMEDFEYDPDWMGDMPFNEREGK